MSGGARNFAMFEDPQSLAASCASRKDFDAQFGTEERCEAWVRLRRWPKGFKCPRCGGTGEWDDERRGYQCRKCRKFCSLTAGTLLHRTRKPLRQWFEALFLVVQRGVNARTLQREIGLTYKVAWTWGHKLRSLLGAFAVPEDLRPPRERRHVAYEAERARHEPIVTTPCGCTKLLGRDWGWENEMDEEEEASRLWRRFANGRSTAELWPRKMPDPREPRAADVFAHWELLATYFGSVSEKHLRPYLDELAFRINRRWRAVDEAFAAVVARVVRSEPLSYRRLVGRPEPGGFAVSIFDVRLANVRRRD